MTRIRDIHRTAVVADAADHLVEVACRMRDDDVDALVVMDGDRLAGIITEQELVEAVADGVDLEHALAGEFMTARLVRVDHGTGVQEAARVLAGANARQLVIVADGMVVGTISARDLLRETAS
jgi:signal-transduction protein with cAMP-binding, CBS, and nucleotidyltransferase domain